MQCLSTILFIIIMVLSILISIFIAKDLVPLLKGIFDSIWDKEE